MQALVYNQPGKQNLEDRPKPAVLAPTDAVVRSITCTRHPPVPRQKRWFMLSDILPTGFECGVLNGKVQVGGSVVIVGSGPNGLAALLTAQFRSPSQIIMIDIGDNRLSVSQRFGATDIVNNSDGKAAEQVSLLRSAWR